MSRRCGCGGSCSCGFEAGRGASLTGTDPILIEILDGQAFVRGASTETVQAVVTGAGAASNPYVVTMNEFIGVRRPIVFAFTTAGTYTWTKPSFGTLLRAYLLGGGGGAAGAGSAGPGSDEFRPTAEYARGGGPGAELVVDALLADLPGSMTVTVGAGGSGGSQSTSGVVVQSSGNAGVNGGASSLGSWLVGGGGAGIPGFQGVTDPRTSAAVGAGGAGGLFMDGAESRRRGKPGAAGYYGMSPVGGLGQVATFDANQAGGRSPLQFRPRGTGGGGGYGSIGSFSLGNAAGTPGGAGGPGAGGGGGGIGSQYGGPGGRGGDGAVVILVQ